MIAINLLWEEAERREKQRIKSAEWRARNPERAREQARKNMAAHRSRNPGKANECAKRAYWEDPEKFKQRAKEYRETNSEKFREAQRRYRSENAEQRREWCRAWKARNKERVREHNRIYGNRRRAEDLDFKLRAYLRNRLGAVVASQGASRAGRIHELLGCSWESLRVYLESLFQPGMSWGNYGDWHVDHKRPCASFNLVDPEQQRQCFHFTNLQPLWAVDNIRKGKKILTSLQG